MQRTLKRELKVLEIVKREAIGGSTFTYYRLIYLILEDRYDIRSDPSWLPLILFWFLLDRAFR